MANVGINTGIFEGQRKGFTGEHNAAVKTIALAEGAVKTMFLTKLWVGALVLAVGLLVAGVGAFRQHAFTAPPVADTGKADAGKPDAPKPAAPERAKPRKQVEVPSPLDGILLVIGTEVRKGEKLPPGQVVTVKVGNETKQYRRLQEGDTVEEGQLLARLDDRLARQELEASRARVAIAEADYEAAAASAKEAEARLQRLTNLRQNKVIQEAEVAAAALTKNRYLAEKASKEAGVAVARARLKREEITCQMHEIRSPVRGVIRRIYKRPGEAVKALEPVFQVRIEGREK